MKVRGRCHCGEITYEAEVKPGTVSVCHCRDCQMLSGTAFRAGIPAPAEGFRLLTGKPRKYVKVAEQDPKSYTLRIGALSEPDALGHPAQQIWTKRRLSWMPKLDDVTDIEGQP